MHEFRTTSGSRGELFAVDQAPRATMPLRVERSRETGIIVLGDTTRKVTCLPYVGPTVRIAQHVDVKGHRMLPRTSVLGRPPERPSRVEWLPERNRLHNDSLLSLHPEILGLARIALACKPLARQTKTSTALSSFTRCPLQSSSLLPLTPQSRAL